MRQTKIICTIGPATESYAMIAALHGAGMNVARLNMSHADHATAERVVERVRALNRDVEDPVALLLDTQGPEIRTGELAHNLNLATGDIINVSVRDDTDVERTSIRIHYDELVEAVEVDDRITVDNGLINLDVLDKHGGHLTCRVVDGGVLGSKKHVNLPGVRVNLPAITDKDAADIAWGLEQQVDFIALSFVRRAGDVNALRERLPCDAGAPRIIAKIEDAEGVSNIESIVASSDGVMVARGDLGVEIDLAQLPNVQRRIVRLCQEHGRRVIVATHLLESMIEHPIPTRAEVTDVANAVYEEVDAIMLSGESSVGKYPVKCVELLHSIARVSELTPGLGFTRGLRLDHDKQHLASAAVQLAESLGAQGLVVVTRRGITADYATNCHPQTVPIYAFTENRRTRRRLMLNRHVTAHCIAFSRDAEQTLERAFAVLRRREGLADDAKVAVLSDVLTDGGMDAIQIRTLG